MSQPSSGPGRTLGVGALAGLGAYLLGYLVTYLVTADPIRNSVASRMLDVLTGESAVWKLVGWVFYGEHFVDAIVPGLLAGSNAVNLVTAVETVPEYLFVVPPLALVLAGAVAAQVTTAPRPTEGAVAGALVVLGYLPAAVVGAFVFTITVGDVSAGPDLVTAVLLAGVAYPLVFGIVGGVGRTLLRG